MRNRYFNTGWRPVFPGSSRLGIEPKTPGWLVQAQPIGGSDPTGIWCPGVCLFITQGVCLLLQYLYKAVRQGGKCVFIALPEIGQNLHELDWQSCRSFFNIIPLGASGVSPKPSFSPSRTVCLVFSGGPTSVIGYTSATRPRSETRATAEAP